MPLDILIVGAGTCGPALAFLLHKSNSKHHITVVERSTSLRLGGHQIDLKAEGLSAVEKMGFLSAVKSICVKETGVEIVDTNGVSLMRFGVDNVEGRGLTLTSEYEMMRGDLVKVFYDASLRREAGKEGLEKEDGSLIYEFGKTITELDTSDNGVNVTFSDGRKRRFDLVVGADGQGSRTRRLAFGQATSMAAFEPLGVHAAYYSIPRTGDENDLARAYFGPGSRAMMTRTSGRPTTQAYLFLMGDPRRHEDVKHVHQGSVDEQKSEWSRIFSDAGWQSDRFIAGMKTCEDFYACEIGQLKMPQLYTGRTVLLGDAGYCPSPFTGMGTSLSLIGAYVLAGELARHEGDLDKALKEYAETMRQPIEEYQVLPSGSDGRWIPTTQLGLRIMNNVLWAASCLKIDVMISWIHGMLPDSKPRWVLPNYPELDFGTEGGL